MSDDLTTIEEVIHRHMEDPSTSWSICLVVDVGKQDCRAFRCFWSAALAAVQLATGPIFDGRVLARTARPGLCPAPAPRPIGTELPLGK